MYRRRCGVQSLAASAIVNLWHGCSSEVKARIYGQNQIRKLKNKNPTVLPIDRVSVISRAARVSPGQISCILLKFIQMWAAR